jgi:hypothetical protein
VSEEFLGEVRRLYGDMAFSQAALRLATEESRLVEGRLPSPELVKVLVELEMWLGTCLLFGHDERGAAERFAFAHELSSTAKPDPVLPPEVSQAFARARPAKPIPLRLQIAPPNARVWLDGRLRSEPVLASPGLHYLVVERADRRPLTRILRISAAAPDLTANLSQLASRDEAVRQAVWRLSQGPLEEDEGTGVAVAQGRSLWVVSENLGRFSAIRFAEDPAQPPRRIAAADVEALVDSMCKMEPRCSPAFVPTAAQASPPLNQVPQPAPSSPIWKRTWFWVAVGVVAVGTGVVIAETAPRDYVARVRP